MKRYLHVVWQVWGNEGATASIYVSHVKLQHAVKLALYCNEIPMLLKDRLTAEWSFSGKMHVFIPSFRALFTRSLLIGQKGYSNI